MDENSRPHRAHLVNEFLHDNIARLEWPACSADMNPIEHAWAVFGRDDPSNTLTDLRRIAVEEWENLDQQDLDEQYATTNTGMHQCKMTCYWELETLVYAATSNTNSEVLLYYCTTCSFWFS